MDHLNENLGAANVQLTPADLRAIETAFSKIKVHGGRMAEIARALPALSRGRRSFSRQLLFALQPKLAGLRRRIELRLGRHRGSH